MLSKILSQQSQSQAPFTFPLRRNHSIGECHAINQLGPNCFLPGGSQQTKARENFVLKRQEFLGYLVQLVRADTLPRLLGARVSAPSGLGRSVAADTWSLIDQVDSLQRAPSVGYEIDLARMHLLSNQPPRGTECSSCVSPIISLAPLQFVKCQPNQLNGLCGAKHSLDRSIPRNTKAIQHQAVWGHKKDGIGWPGAPQGGAARLSADHWPGSRRRTLGGPTSGRRPARACRPDLAHFHVRLGPVRRKPIFGQELRCSNTSEPERDKQTCKPLQASRKPSIGEQANNNK